MKTVYFSHDRDARSDPKVIKLRMQYGMEGYGCYFALLEMMFSESDYSLPYDQEQFDAIAYDLRTSFDIRVFIDRCIEIGLFHSDGASFWSRAFRRRTAEQQGKAQSRSVQASKAASAMWNRRKPPKSEPSEPEAEPTPEPTPEPESAPEPVPAPIPEPAPEREPEPEPDADPEWVRVLKAYEQTFGAFPYGRECDQIVSYYEDMGADVLCEAIEQARRANPNKPAPFLLAILARWAEQGVDTVEKAKAATAEHEARAAAYKRRPEPPPEPPAIRGKFY
ncbi:Lin1244/Lin1753 domain-containing protein [Faecousia sp.]|uniref:Lin1244/Lin1753 domain-containing protein n=1 Tax=Faecousia sp. TaxID=2952921 RepID=UPI003AB2911E